MQNVLDRNIHIIKFVCSIALIYIAFKVLRKLFGIDLFISFKEFFSKEKKKIIKKPNIEDELLFEVKSKQHILFKLPKENANAIQELNINSYNFTPIVNKFSILTYNILCQKFMMRRDRKDLSLENRMEKIKNQISLLDPDIICLQETVFHSIKLHLESFLSLKYEIFYKENYGSNFYNLTAFKKDKFEFKEDKKINLDEIKVEGNRGIYCLELKIKNKNNTTNQSSLNNLNSKSYKNNNALINQKKSEDNKNEIQLLDSKENLKGSENSIGEENNSNAFLQSNQQVRLSKYNKNKEKSNFFYNYKNFIEYNKAENKNKLVIYNVHFPWKPIFDFEKCLILNKIADDINFRNQRNYIIIGDFNSKPNSLLMRMIYIENFINEIKYFKNIINFKSEYFKKRNSEDAVINNKNSGFYDYENDSNQITKAKYSYIDTDKFKSLLDKSNSKSIYKTEEVAKVNELISDFDILKELKDIKNKSNEKKQKDDLHIKENISKNEDNSVNNDSGKNNASNNNNSSENNQNFWTKLSEQKHKENETNKRIKEYDLLKELFYINVKIQKEKHNFRFDLRDKANLKEILKLFSLSDNKQTFENFYSNQNLLINKENQYNNHNLKPTSFHLQSDILNSSEDYSIDQKHLDIYSRNNKNQFNLNINNQNLRNHSKYFNNDNLPYSEYYNNLFYNPQYSQNQIYQNIENKHVSMSVGPSISNDNYNKIRNMFDNFKNLFIKYKFRSAYESYQIEYRKNLNSLRNMGLKHLVDFSQSKSIKENIEESKNLETNLETKSNNECKEKLVSEKGNNEKRNTPTHISDYYRYHPLYTNFTDNFKDTIDYIFYSKYLIVDKILKLPDYNELIEEGFLPSSEHPSDHLPLYAEFSTN